MRACSVRAVLDGDEESLRLDVHVLRCARLARADAVGEQVQRMSKDGFGIDGIVGLLGLLAGRV